MGQRSAGIEDHRSCTDGSKSLALQCEFSDFFSQLFVILQMECTRHPARQYDHVAAIVISLFKQQISLDLHAMGSFHHFIFHNGNHLHIDRCPAKQVYYRDRFHFFKSFCKMYIYHVIVPL